MNENLGTVIAYGVVFGISLFTLLIGYAFGRKNEQKHLNALIQKESRFKNLVRILQTKRNPFPDQYQSAMMVTGSVVIANDSFKKLLAHWRGIFGGEMKSYHSLLTRGRREALIRVQEKAHALGADTVINIRFETMSISNGAKKRLHSVEVLAYGTALIGKS